MTIFISSDHAGVELKKGLVEFLTEKGYQVRDLGPSEVVKTDAYPLYAKKLCAEVVQNPEHKGILICGTGIGMSMAANKVKGIRAAVCLNEYMAKSCRSHNDANVLCLGSRVIGPRLAQSITSAWIETAYEGGRHDARLKEME